MKPLSQQQLSDALLGETLWKVDGGQLVRKFVFATFTAAMAFVNVVADRSEMMNHHPDIDIRYDRVRLALVTHDAGGITQRDIDLAREISSIAAG